MNAVEDIYWDSIYLTFALDGKDDDSCSYFLQSSDGRQRFPVPCKNGLIKINITNVTGIKNNEMLSPGEWDIVQCRDSQDFLLLLSVKAAQKLENLSRVFPYCGDCYGYGISFKGIQSADGITCRIISMYFKKNRHPKKDSIVIESDSFKEFCILAATGFFVGLIRVFYFFASKCRRRDHRHLMFMSETKKEIAGNLLSLDRWAQKNDTSYVISHSFHATLTMPKLQVIPYWFSLAFKLAAQDAVVIDDYAPIFKVLNLHEETKLIQVWHAGLGFKSVGYSRFGREDSPRPFRSGYRKYDYVIVGSTNLIPVYAEVFGLPENKILPLGLAKIDDFLDQTQIDRAKARLYRKYEPFRGKTMVLFAPTYRGDGQGDAFYPTKMLDFKRIYDFCGTDKIFAVKMHPFVKNTVNVPEGLSDRIVDVSSENINDLLHLSDVLVTDYSSVIYEYALLNRPILFYAFDMDEYKINRGFHWDFEENAPGKICRTFNELMESLKQLSFNQSSIEKFKNFAFDHLDRQGCARFYDFLNSILDNQTKKV